jgi:glycosyltransferase involved in cell wall biosynthesis
MKRVAIVANFPPPIHGLSKAVDTLYRSSLSQRYRLIPVDIKRNFFFPLHLLRILCSRADLFYFCISQSVGGNLRDLVYLQCMAFRRKKIVIHLHGGYFRSLYRQDMGKFQRRLNQRLFRSVDKAIVLGESLRNMFEGLVAEEAVVIVPNCIDDQFLIQPAEFARKLEQLTSQPVLTVLYLSNLIRGKGYATVLAIAQLARQNQDARFRFILAGAYATAGDQQFVEDYVRQHQLQSLVTYRGVVQGSEKLELLKASQVFILPTNYRKEGQPISIIEAMGSGMAIFTTDHAGIPDLVHDGENGIIASQEDAPRYYQALGDLFQDREKLRAICRVNRAKVEEGYLEEHYLSKLDKIFGEKL